MKEKETAITFKKWLALENAKYLGKTIDIVGDFDENDCVKIKIIPSKYPKPTWERFIISKEYIAIKTKYQSKHKKSFDDIPIEDIDDIDMYLNDDLEDNIDDDYLL